jgi:phosphoglycerate dehydrogenase-like enzyme
VEPLTCVVTDSTVHRFAAALEALVEPPARWRYCHDANENELIEAIADADVYVGANLPPRVAAAARRLRLVQSTGIGIDRIAVDSLATNVQIAAVDGHGDSVAEHVVMVTLALYRRLLLLDANLRRGEWVSGAFQRSQPLGETLRGKNLGLIGYGTIGRHTGLLARHFGTRVAAIRSDASRFDPSDEYLDWSGGSADLHRLLSWSDVAVVSIPLSEATRGLIDSAALSCMSPDSIIVNVARGPVVDEDSLYNALITRSIRGAALDVWYRYPTISEPSLPSNRPFWELDNVILTPHDSSATTQTYEQRIEQIAANIQGLSRGRSLSRLVRSDNAEPSEAPPASTGARRIPEVRR